MFTRRSLLHALAMISAPLAIAAGQDAMASLRGTVTDSIRHGPLVGATVVASPVNGSGARNARIYSATTDARGKFSLAVLPRDTYVLTVEHPWLDSTGLGVPARKVDLLARRSATVNLAVPSGATIRSAFCSTAARDSTTGLIAGYVNDARSQHPVSDARVVFAWSDFDVDPNTAVATPHDRIVAANTTHDGTFRMCGLPVGHTILVQAQFGDRDARGITEVQIPQSGVLVETLLLEGDSVHGTAASGDTARDDPQSAGHGNAATATLRGATALNAVQIVGTRTAANTRNSEFDERSAHGAGQYITEEMIAKANAAETAELMQQVHGFYVMSDTVYSTRGTTALPSTNPTRQVGRVCQPALYIDGIRGVRTMDDIPPSVIHGIEIYESSVSVPPRYQGSLCGVILIWTK